MAGKKAAAPKIKAPCFEIRTGTSGLYWFVLRAGNGEVVMTSEMYPTKANAKRGVFDVIATFEDGLTPPIVDGTLKGVVRDRLPTSPWK